MPFRHLFIQVTIFVRVNHYRPKYGTYDIFGIDARLLEIRTCAKEVTVNNYRSFKIVLSYIAF